MMLLAPLSPADMCALQGEGRERGANQAKAQAINSPLAVWTWADDKNHVGRELTHN